MPRQPTHSLKISDCWVASERRNRVVCFDVVPGCAETRIACSTSIRKLQNNKEGVQMKKTATVGGAYDAACFEDRYCRATIATLCDPQERGITCSEHIAHTVLLSSNIFPCGSFEDAATAVLQGKSDYLLVPSAYPHVASFIQSDALALCDMFISPIPPLVVAGILTTCPSHVDLLYYHPATESLIAETGIERIEEAESVCSNAAACYAVKNATNVAACITNRLCANRLGLITYKTLRPAQPMPFLIFRKRDEGEADFSAFLGFSPKPGPVLQVAKVT